jgi:hypothetical protein
VKINYRSESNTRWKFRRAGDKAGPILLEALEGRRLKLADTHPHTLESLNILIDLYEAWNKHEKAKDWQTKLAQIQDFEE